MHEEFVAVVQARSSRTTRRIADVSGDGGGTQGQAVKEATAWNEDWHTSVLVATRACGSGITVFGRLVSREAIWGLIF
jgi:hypothetical protein